MICRAASKTTPTTNKGAHGSSASSTIRIEPGSPFFMWSLPSRVFCCCWYSVHLGVRILEIARYKEMTCCINVLSLAVSCFARLSAGGRGSYHTRRACSTAVSHQNVVLFGKLVLFVKDHYCCMLPLNLGIPVSLPPLLLKIAPSTLTHFQEREKRVLEVLRHVRLAHYRKTRLRSTPARAPCALAVVVLQGAGKGGRVRPARTHRPRG